MDLSPAAEESNHDRHSSAANKEEMLSRERMKFWWSYRFFFGDINSGLRSKRRASRWKLRLCCAGEDDTASAGGGTATQQVSSSS
ncbi:unnamed protein product [Linum trigynum]|uniref:Uncharacterized protein n=1 Tax=Linum trigynum TaxID=586398 RepID=A0AAV2G3Y4_9ROSI